MYFRDCHGDGGWREGGGDGNRVRERMGRDCDGLDWARGKGGPDGDFIATAGIPGDAEKLEEAGGLDDAGSDGGLGNGEGSGDCEEAWGDRIRSELGCGDDYVRWWSTNDNSICLIVNLMLRLEIGEGELTTDGHCHG